MKNKTLHTHNKIESNRDHLVLIRISLDIKTVGNSCHVILLLVERVNSRNSVKQTLEFILTVWQNSLGVLCHPIKEIWLQNFVTGLQIMDDIERPLKLLRDNNLQSFTLRVIWVWLSRTIWKIKNSEYLVIYWAYLDKLWNYGSVL